MKYIVYLWLLPAVLLKEVLYAAHAQIDSVDAYLWLCIYTAYFASGYYLLWDHLNRAKVSSEELSSRLEDISGRIGKLEELGGRIEKLEKMGDGLDRRIEWLEVEMSPPCGETLDRRVHRLEELVSPRSHVIQRAVRQGTDNLDQRVTKLEMKVSNRHGNNLEFRVDRLEEKIFSRYGESINRRIERLEASLASGK